MESSLTLTIMIMVMLWIMKELNTTCTFKTLNREEKMASFLMKSTPWMIGSWRRGKHKFSSQERVNRVNSPVDEHTGQDPLIFIQKGCPGPVRGRKQFRMGGDKKIVITAVGSVIVVAFVVAAVVVVIKKDPPPPTSGKGPTSIKSMCRPTEYKETCEKTLLTAKNTTDQKQLIMTLFTATLDEIAAVIKKTDDLRKASTDTNVSMAYKLCHELLDDSIDDVHRTLDKFNGSDLINLDNNQLSDLNTWLAGSLTCQETCLDGFEDTDTHSHDKMMRILKTSREMASNSLTIMDEFSRSNRRRVLDGYGYPSWVDPERRRILQGSINPHVVVARDGSGKYRTINEALKEVPWLGNKPFVIYVKAGVYAEYVTIDKHMTHVVLVGDGPARTRITGDRSHAKGFQTFWSATVAVDGFYFTAKDLWIENTAGSGGHQAVALRSSSDMSIFHNVQIDGYQDTLYVHDHRQFYRDCTISGTIDFIFGNAAAFFQSCRIIIRKPDPGQSCMITAQGRTQEHSHTGIVLHHCYITGAPDLVRAGPSVRAFLGRPWKRYSRTVVINSYIDSVIDPEGWAPWVGRFGTQSNSTCWYGEYGNRGLGAGLSRRVNWPCIKKINGPEEAARFTAGNFLHGDSWIPASGVPYERGI